MPPKKTRNANAPHQHDKRHESGLAAPGRPIARKRSSGQLHDQSNGKPQHPPLPSTGLNGFRFPRPPPDSESTAADHAAGPGLRERDRTSSDASMDGVGPCGEMAESGHDNVSAMINAEFSSAAGKNNYGHSAGTFSTVSTILTYYPLRDAISILILLLSLPPTLVLVIQTLFASLTFVPPTAGLSLATLPNIKEMFNSPNFGYPALATILFVDMVFWVIWLAVSGWKPAQAIWLDLSQAVIAVSLSGAAASPGGPTHSIAICTLIVVAVHMLRYKAIHLTALDYLRSVLHNLDIGIPLDAPSFATSFHSATPIERGMAWTAVRTILGIHIFSQGVTTCIRRYLASAKANEKDSNVSAIVRTDTEATAGAEPSSRSSTGLSDVSPHVHSASSTDGRPPGQPPAHRDAKQRESSSKKKRKQANEVRSRQPLWAAIASTKVTFVKEMEQRDAADDGREAVAKHNNTTTHFASNTNTTTDRLWIYEVRDTEIHFEVELSATSAAENADQDDTLSVTSAIDKSKPFFIRINGAAWSSARIEGIEDADKPAGSRFRGEIFGLAPLGSFHCEIVSIATQRVLCSAKIITQPAPTAEQTTAQTPPQHQSLRPSSPITTLKQSIQAAEAKLNETRNRTKKNKKDQKNAHGDIKKEIALLKTKVNSSGGIDEKQERRQIQLTQHKNQAEEATADLKKQIEALGEIPADEQTAANLKRRAWQSALDSKEAAERDFDNAVAEQEVEVKALESDVSASKAKRERLAARNAQRTQELEKLTAKQQAELTARQERDLKRDQTRLDRENRQSQMQTHITQMEQETSLWASKAHEAYQQAATLFGWSSQQPPPGYPSYSSPPTPEGVLPGSQNGQISPQANGFPPSSGTAVPFGPHSQAFGSPFAPTAQPALLANPTGPQRGRSSSMLSQYSGFTDPGAEDTLQPPYAFDTTARQQSWPLQSSAGANFPTAPTMDRKFSDGGETSGSGSGSGNSLVNGSTNGSNSPRPDAKVFVPGSTASAAKSVGTIGPPNGGKQKNPQSPESSSVGAVGSGR